MKRARAGYTLLEVAIVNVILVAVLSAGVMAMRASQRSFEQTVTSGVVNAQASRALNRITRELTGARRGTLVLSAEGDSASFQEVAGWVAGAPTWSNDVWIHLEYEPNELDNGLDDDGDGFADECQVLLTENVGQADERTVVLVNSVSEFLQGELPDGIDNNGNSLEDERGLCFEFQEAALVIRLTLQRRDPEGVINVRTLNTIVGLRN